MLKMVSNEMSGMWSDAEVVYHFGISFITKDRTVSVAEREERRKLVAELRQKIDSDRSRKWVIRFGTVETVGAFNQA